MTLPKRHAALIVSANLAAIGILHLASRAVIRTWVFTRHDQFVVLYSGNLSLAVGMAAIVMAALVAATGATAGVKGEADRGLVNAGLALLWSSNAGFLAAAIVQGWLHVARLAILPENFIHPRSLTSLSACLAVAAFTLIVYGWNGGASNMDAGRY